LRQPVYRGRETFADKSARETQLSAAVSGAKHKRALRWAIFTILLQMANNWDGQTKSVR
jgi:hypothetical protein